MLEIGLEVMLNVTDKSITTVMRGWRNGKNSYLLLELSGSDKESVELTSKTPVTMKFENRGATYNLHGLFVSFFEKTDIGMFLVAEDIKENSKRSAERFRCLLPVMVIDETGKTIGSGMISDLSFGGAKVYFLDKLPLSEGDFMTLNFSLTKSSIVKKQQFEIKRISDVDGKQVCGGQFYENEEQLRQKLERFFVFNKMWEFTQNLG